MPFPHEGLTKISLQCTDLPLHFSELYIMGNLKALNKLLGHAALKVTGCESVMAFLVTQKPAKHEAK